MFGLEPALPPVEPPLGDAVHVAVPVLPDPIGLAKPLWDVGVEHAELAPTGKSVCICCHVNIARNGDTLEVLAESPRPSDSFMQTALGHYLMITSPILLHRSITSATLVLGRTTTASSMRLK